MSGAQWGWGGLGDFLSAGWKPFRRNTVGLLHPASILSHSHSSTSFSRCWMNILQASCLGFVDSGLERACFLGEMFLKRRLPVAYVAGLCGRSVSDKSPLKPAAIGCWGCWRCRGWLQTKTNQRFLLVLMLEREKRHLRDRGATEGAAACHQLAEPHGTPDAPGQCSSSQSALHRRRRRHWPRRLWPGPEPGLAVWSCNFLKRILKGACFGSQFGTPSIESQIFLSARVGPPASSEAKTLSRGSWSQLFTDLHYPFCSCSHSQARSCGGPVSSLGMVLGSHVA